jgi:hypothetical protein
MLGYMTGASKRELRGAVPEFFQQRSPEALRLQTDWLTEQLGVNDQFFAHLTGQSEEFFSMWRAGVVDAPAVDESLHDFWRTVLHLLSLLNFDTDQLGELFRSVSSGRRESPSSTPWHGVTLQTYLEQGGQEAVAKVESWVTGLRFGDPVPS